jgi:RHS repeat-associated protein
LTNCARAGGCAGFNYPFLTQKERDIETGLDYFLARYYSSSQGRFTGVDPEQEGARNDDPQSWNGYAYTGGNPVARTDPDGKKYLVCNSEGKSCVEYSDEDFYRIRRENQKDYGFTGNRNFYESGAITQKGETIGTYVQVSIDDPVGQFIFQMRRQTAPIGNATAAFFGISVVAGATGGAVVYALGPAPAVTTLGLATRVGPAAAGAGGVLSQLGQKDAAIFEKAGEYGLSGANSFLNNLQALTRAVVEKIPGGQLNKLGQIGNSPIYGSGRSGVGIAEVDGVTVVVKVVHGNPQVLGPVP